MTEKFTPGPWNTVTNHEGAWDVAADDGEGDMVADLNKCRNAEANAALIASSPDLYAALLLIVNAYDSRGGCDELRMLAIDQAGGIEAARAALAKANGE